MLHEHPCFMSFDISIDFTSMKHNLHLCIYDHNYNKKTMTQTEHIRRKLTVSKKMTGKIKSEINCIRDAGNKSLCVLDMNN